MRRLVQEVMMRAPVPLLFSTLVSVSFAAPAYGQAPRIQTRQPAEPSAPVPASEPTGSEDEEPTPEDDEPTSEGEEQASDSGSSNAPTSSEPASSRGSSGSAVADVEPVADAPMSDAATVPSPPGTPAGADEAGEGAADAAPAGPQLTFHPMGYVETYFAWSFNQPSNGVIAYRGFDNRHASFNLSNVAIGGRLEYDRVYANIVLQWGTTPATYYLAEPSAPAVAGVGASNANLWQVLQQAYLGWNIPILERGLLLEAGLFLSPVGIESLAVADNWNYSRANLFYGFPFYHTGLRATLPIDGEWSATVAVYNGWNTILDDNLEKSVSGTIAYTSDRFSAHLLYFGGVEEPTGAPQRGWRNLFDLIAYVKATDWLEFQGQATGGFEPRTDGMYTFMAGALYARVTPIRWFDVALRGDFFYDDAPQDSMGARINPIFWPAQWVSEFTATLTFRPIEQLLFRIEYRHDQAAGPIYFAGAVPQDVNGVDITNAGSQDTVTFGAVAYLH